MNNKPIKNYIKALDRIAPVISLPVAICGLFFVKSEYINRNAVDVDYSCETKNAASKLLLDKTNEGRWPEQNPWWFRYTIIGGDGGYLARGRNGLKEAAEKSPFAELQIEKALEAGADPNGDWVNKESFGLKKAIYYDPETKEEYESPTSIIPGQWKRFLAGLIGLVGSYLLSLLALVGSTRFVKHAAKFTKKYCGWVKKGLEFQK